MSRTMMQQKKVFVIGVGGASGSGKSSLVDNLAESFSARVVHMDNYFDRRKIREELDGNWEVPEAVDIDACLRQLDTHVAELRATSRTDSPGIVIVEGFLLFAWPSMCHRCDVRILIQVPEAICRERRFQREKRQVVDRIKFDSFFDNVWHHYQYFLPLQTENASTEPIRLQGDDGIGGTLSPPQLCLIDGTQATTAVVSEATLHLASFGIVSPADGQATCKIVDTAAACPHLLWP